MARLCAHVYLQRAVAVARGRLRQLRERMAAGGGGSRGSRAADGWEEALAGCGAEHCAALSGSMWVIDEVLDSHAMWAQVGRVCGGGGCAECKLHVVTDTWQQQDGVLCCHSAQPNHVHPRSCASCTLCMCVR